MTKQTIDLEYMKFLSELITPERLKRFEDILENRTKYICVALEDLFQEQNASAVLRTCDCFGIQDVHVIENNHDFMVNPEIALGASKWLTLKKHNKKENNTLDTIHFLRKSGYRIVATTPAPGKVELGNFDLKKGKIALFFGTELNGLSDTMQENADEFLSIPMYGFTESFNISVSAGIILHHLTYLMRKSEINWKINDQEKYFLKIQWMKNTLKTPDIIEKSYYSKKQ